MTVGVTVLPLSLEKDSYWLITTTLLTYKENWRDGNLFTLVAREYQPYKLDPMGFASLIEAWRLTSTPVHGSLSFMGEKLMLTHH